MFGGFTHLRFTEKPQKASHAVGWIEKTKRSDDGVNKSNKVIKNDFQMYFNRRR